MGGLQLTVAKSIDDKDGMALCSFRRGDCFSCRTEKDVSEREPLAYSHGSDSKIDLGDRRVALLGDSNKT